MTLSGHSSPAAGQAAALSRLATPALLRRTSFQWRHIFPSSDWLAPKVSAETRRGGRSLDVTGRRARRECPLCAT
jgi:hypothetical protein